MGRTLTLKSRQQPVVKEVASDPLGSALQVLRGNDPLVETAQRQIWRKLWVRDTIGDWIGRLAHDPKFFEELHKAIPDDVDLLQEIRNVAFGHNQSLQAICIVGLVNERLERCQARENVSFYGSRSLAVGESNVAISSRDRMGHLTASDRLNYSGFVCAGVQWRDGRWMSGTAEFPNDVASIPTKTPCRLAVWMQPNQPVGAWAAEVLIETGIEMDLVNFSVEADCATLHIPYGRKRVRFHRREKSDLMSFDFITPTSSGEHVVFVQVFQGNSLVKTFEVILKISGKK